MATKTPSSENVEIALHWLANWSMPTTSSAVHDLAHLLDTMMLKARLEEHKLHCHAPLIRLTKDGKFHESIRCGEQDFICERRKDLERQLQERGERT